MALRKGGQRVFNFRFSRQRNGLQKNFQTSHSSANHSFVTIFYTGFYL